MPQRVGTVCPHCHRRRPIGQRCPTCTSRRGASTTTGRGYGSQHQKLRAQWAPIVALGNMPCARCGQVIKRGQPWDLGHVPGSRTRYRGPEHESCNRDTKTGDDE
jgi:hypothetical protein